MAILNRRTISFAILFCAILFAAPPALARPGAPSGFAGLTSNVNLGGQPAASDADSEEKVAPDSPRAAISSFLDLCRRGQYAEAAQYLDLSSRVDGRTAEQTAARLYAVLRRHLAVDLDDVSPLSTGSTSDGLKPDIDELGRISLQRGAPSESVRIVRRTRGDETRWLFSRATTDRVDDWYGTLRGLWLRERLSPWLLRVGPFDLLVYQWLALPIVLLIATMLSFGFASVSQRLLHRFLVLRGARSPDAAARFVGPLRLAWTCALIAAVLPWGALDKDAIAFIESLLRAGFEIASLWALIRAVDEAARLASGSPWSRSHQGSLWFLPTMRKVAKGCLLAIGLVAVLSELGYPVASLVAGLGLAGLALTLAAQKTLENVFGAAALGLDHPFQVGDLVTVDTVLGHVEALGLRSTRIRTYDRTVVSFPNSKIAEMRIENFSVRDRYRVHCILPIAFETNTARIEACVSRLYSVLRDHPKSVVDTVGVFMSRLNSHAIEMDINAGYKANDVNDFYAIRHLMISRILATVRDSGLSLALPSMTVKGESLRLLTDSPAQPAPTTRG